MVDGSKPANGDGADVVIVLTADSDGSRTGVPIEAEDQFRRKPNTRSERSRTLIPSEAEHPA
jgi:hypothetical protein